MSLKKVCSKCNKNLIKIDEKYCGDCAENVEREKKQQWQYYDKVKRNQESKVIYQSKEWKKARTMTLIRDNYLCQDCLDSRITYATMVHHITPIVEGGEPYDVNNLVSLCDSCHGDRHSEIDKKM
ncbi:HNH endonuclease [Clostridium formicaceticum]|uniref:Putative HNH nuclease YajD n=1 Tax=Clostridium formicaceticum TaxID=1497 RepID=A0AAC9RJS3_9CLOT|nr:HNH endonuclease signature motif containing protein [Clostridium formicaceticum]ARE87386.1 HNH endonuclease [Clostridium formicaceticum]